MGFLPDDDCDRIWWQDAIRGITNEEWDRIAFAISPQADEDWGEVNISVSHRNKEATGGFFGIITYWPEEHYWSWPVGDMLPKSLLAAFEAYINTEYTI